MIADHFPGEVLKILRDKGINDGEMAIELNSYALPAVLAEDLGNIHKPLMFTDSTNLFGGLRHCKSALELIYMRATGRYANIGLETFKKTTKESIVSGQIDPVLSAK